MTLPMNRVTLAVGALLAALLCVALLLTVGSQTAQAGCTAQANAPYYDNGTIKTWGYVDCITASTAPWYMDGQLTRDGTGVDTDGCWAYGSSRCHSTPAAPNRSGDQRWCNRVSGGSEFAYERTCESQGF